MTLRLPKSRIPPLTAGLIRNRAEDFRVDEQLGFDLDGEGEHLWLHVQKTDNNTDWVARLLARMAGVQGRDVGYAGLKDRYAITTQWFSVPDTHEKLEFEPGPIEEGIEILACRRHTRKLRRGALQGNRFAIRVREVEGNMAVLEQTIEDIRIQGVPNYFGEQRFGRGGHNVSKARDMFNRKYRPRNKQQKGILLSAARSELFNRVLAERVAQGSWCQALEGDVFELQGSHSIFVPEEIEQTIKVRVSEGDIHPTGPMWGRGCLLSGDGVRDMEEGVAAQDHELAKGLEHAGLKQERRALRFLIPDLSLTVEDERTLVFEFSLPSGTYATSLLRELVDYRDVSVSG
jgi:tRNA pseudouridine13 synthase